MVSCALEPDQEKKGGKKEKEKRGGCYLNGGCPHQLPPGPLAVVRQAVDNVRGSAALLVVCGIDLCVCPLGNAAEWLSLRAVRWGSPVLLFESEGGLLRGIAGIGWGGVNDGTSANAPLDRRRSHFYRGAPESREQRIGRDINAWGMLGGTVGLSRSAGWLGPDGQLDPLGGSEFLGRFLRGNVRHGSPAVLLGSRRRSVYRFGSHYKWGVRPSEKKALRVKTTRFSCRRDSDVRLGNGVLETGLFFFVFRYLVSQS